MTKTEARQVLNAFETLELAPLMQCFHCYQMVYDFEGRSRCWRCGGPYLMTVIKGRPLLRSGTDLGIYDFKARTEGQQEDA